MLVKRLIVHLGQEGFMVLLGVRTSGGNGDTPSGSQSFSWFRFLLLLGYYV